MSVNRERLEKVAREIIEKGNKAIDLSVKLGLAYIGYDTFKHPAGSLYALVAYRLATTMGGTPPVSQIAGLTGLSLLGLSYGGDLGDAESRALTKIIGSRWLGGFIYRAIGSGLGELTPADPSPKIGDIRDGQIFVQVGVEPATWWSLAYIQQWYPELIP